MGWAVGRAAIVETPFVVQISVFLDVARNPDFTKVLEDVGRLAQWKGERDGKVGGVILYFIFDECLGVWL